MVESEMFAVAVAAVGADTLKLALVSLAVAAVHHTMPAQIDRALMRIESPHRV